MSTTSLPVREAYRRWAELYDVETAVSALDERAVRNLTPPLAGKALLDAGCGTGRRLPEPAAMSRVIGADLVFEMLAAGTRRGVRGSLVNADFRALPFADGCFDVVWCRLAIGHVPDPGIAYREFARVSRPGACLIVTDFHPDAAGAGHTRTFRDAEGRLHEIEHHVHTPAAHERAAGDAGWRPAARLDLIVGPEIRTFYEHAGMLDRYEEQRGLPLVLALCFRR